MVQLLAAIRRIAAEAKSSQLITSSRLAWASRPARTRHARQSGANFKTEVEGFIISNPPLYRGVGLQNSLRTRHYVWRRRELNQVFIFPRCSPVLFFALAKITLTRRSNGGGGG